MARAKSPTRAGKRARGPGHFLAALAAVLAVALALGAPQVAAQGAACPPGGPVVALDVGHSPEVPGATSARGVPEYAFNLALAQEIADAARQIGIRAVLLDDAARGPFRLSQRPLAAARRGATLFLSIHHDSVQPRYIETWVHDGQERRFSDRYRGYSLFVSARSSRLKESRDLADRIGDGLLGAGLKPTLHHAEDIPGERKPLLDARRGVYRYDNLIVLHRSPLPAVLVEAGVIVHRDEELVLAQPQFRARFAAAVARAVAAYCRR